MKSTEARKLIGKIVAWDYGIDRHRGTAFLRIGTLTEVKNRNVVVDGNYYWLSDLANFRLATKEDLEFQAKRDAWIAGIRK